MPDLLSAIERAPERQRRRAEPHRLIHVFSQVRLKRGLIEQLRPLLKRQMIGVAQRRLVVGHRFAMRAPCGDPSRRNRGEAHHSRGGVCLGSVMNEARFKVRLFAAREERLKNLRVKRLPSRW